MATDPKDFAKVLCVRTCLLLSANGRTTVRRPCSAERVMAQKYDRLLGWRPRHFSIVIR